MAAVMRGLISAIVKVVMTRVYTAGIIVKGKKAFMTGCVVWQMAVNQGFAYWNFGTKTLFDMKGIVWWNSFFLSSADTTNDNMRY
jgi:hypothetical protein